LSEAAINTLLVEGMRRDCARINILAGLSAYLDDPGDDERDPDDPTPYAVRQGAVAFTRFADAVYEAGCDFVDAIDNIIDVSTLKKAKSVDFLCARCRDPYCSAYSDTGPPIQMTVTYIDLNPPGK